MPRIVKFLFKVGLALGLVATIAVGGLFYHYGKDLPDHDQLRNYHPPAVTRIYSADGKLMEEYAKQHRIFIPISNVPKQVIHAFIAAEDKNYYSHVGIDFVSILRAAISNAANFFGSKRLEGGSTITQQVVKNFLLTSERSYERKIKEAILSYRISNILTKDQILELYLNQIYLGKGSYGIASAALNYFNKSPEELTLEEAALLAGMPKAPSQFSPTRNYDRALERRNYVLSRMFEDGYIDAESSTKAMLQPISLRKKEEVETLDAGYYAEQVRSEVIAMFGEEFFYNAGLTIMTCMDSAKQIAAEEALINGLIKYDRKKGYRGPHRRIELSSWQDDLRKLPIPISIKNDILAVVLEAKPSYAKIGFSDGSTGRITLPNMKWAKKGLKNVATLLKPGDIVPTKPIAAEPGHYSLEQIPQVNGGIMVMEPGTGKVLASCGGYDFATSRFDRVLHAKRQPGSTVKALVYLTALENGFKPNMLIDDEEIEVDIGNGLPPWKPKNYDGEFLGKMTMRKGLEKSRNAVTVRLGLAVGLNKITNTISRLGINKEPPKFHSLLLGALETTLSKMTTAFGVIASGGHKITPHYIEMIKDRNGKIIYKRDYTECRECNNYVYDEYGNIMPPNIALPEGEELIDEATNYQITSLMEGGVKRGTSRKARALKKTIAGKTGTSNNSHDTWYIGFTPRIVVGTYVGYDQPRSLGEREYGATIPLPIFVEFMKNGYADTASVDFKVPRSIHFEKVEYETGAPAADDSEGVVINEAFKNFQFAAPGEGEQLQDYDAFIKLGDPSGELY